MPDLRCDHPELTAMHAITRAEEQRLAKPSAVARIGRVGGIDIDRLDSWRTRGMTLPVPAMVPSLVRMRWDPGAPR